MITCRCGGKMKPDESFRDQQLKKLMHHKPFSKNRRIAKKQKKAFMRNPENMAIALSMPLMRSRLLKCATCGITESKISAIGRNAFSVQPLPASAMDLCWEADKEQDGED